MWRHGSVSARRLVTAMRNGRSETAKAGNPDAWFDGIQDDLTGEHSVIRARSLAWKWCAAVPDSGRQGPRIMPGDPVRRPVSGCGDVSVLRARAGPRKALGSEYSPFLVRPRPAGSPPRGTASRPGTGRLATQGR
ncbi:hypothetical protein Franean1_3924 [Parafrankia sp. EAN1pec]|nr:hypothetical protein Franean1_3924 [Frankia sp. EAN1pec]